MSIREFLLARIAEDEAEAQKGRQHNAAGEFARDNYGCLLIQPSRVVAECEAKRAIVAWHDAWPVLVERAPETLAVVGGLESASLRLSHHIAWLTEREYVKKFGEEPPTAPILRILAAVYAEHPDFLEDWAP